MQSFIDDALHTQVWSEVLRAARILEEATGAGRDALGWLELPEKQPKSLYDEIEEAATRIRRQAQAVVVTGIGGSYLGARAVINALSHTFHNEMARSIAEYPAVYYAGINISGSYMQHLLDVIDDRDFSVIVISKSGTTTEPAIAFRLLREKLEEKYGEDEATRRIYVVTDADKGALRVFAREQGYTTFNIPDDIGGRFSVLTPVGLLPIAVAGIDIRALVRGAARAMVELNSDGTDANPCLRYAAFRNTLYRQGKAIELFVSYEPRLSYLSEWWKQLFGESEGKQGKGLFPASVNFTTDLHSLGQYVQDGVRNIFETVLLIEDTGEDVAIPTDTHDTDGLNYLAGRMMSEVNKQAAQGTIQAHVDGGVPNLILTVSELNALTMGYLLYFFEKACAVSGYVLGVNPFDQPGVEAYKRNMFALLRKWKNVK